MRNFRIDLFQTKCARMAKALPLRFIMSSLAKSRSGYKTKDPKRFGQAYEESFEIFVKGCRLFNVELPDLRNEEIRKKCLNEFNAIRFPREKVVTLVDELNTAEKTRVSHLIHLRDSTAKGDIANLARQSSMFMALFELLTKISLSHFSK